jgi:predicted PurR-regulated permease PerM
VLALIVLTWLVLIVLGLWVLSHFARTILLVVLAAVLAFAFTPLANFFQRWTTRPIAIALAYLVGLTIVFGFGAYVIATAVAQVSSLVTNLPRVRPAGGDPPATHRRLAGAIRHLARLDRRC